MREFMRVDRAYKYGIWSSRRFYSTLIDQIYSGLFAVCVQFTQMTIAIDAVRINAIENAVHYTSATWIAQHAFECECECRALFSRSQSPAALNFFSLSLSCVEHMWMAWRKGPYRSPLNSNICSFTCDLYECGVFVRVFVLASFRWQMMIDSHSLRISRLKLFFFSRTHDSVGLSGGFVLRAQDIQIRLLIKNASSRG